MNLALIAATGGALLATGLIAWAVRSANRPMWFDLGPFSRHEVLRMVGAYETVQGYDSYGNPFVERRLRVDWSPDGSSLVLQQHRMQDGTMNLTLPLGPRDKK